MILAVSPPAWFSHGHTLKFLTISTIVAYKVRISPYPKFWSKVKLEINISNSWAPFCHSAWDINMAHEVCQIQGFPEAEAALQGNKLVGNDSCVSNQETNNTCDFLEQQISSSCNFLNNSVAVCKGSNNDQYSLSVTNQTLH